MNHQDSFYHQSGTTANRPYQKKTYDNGYQKKTSQYPVQKQRDNDWPQKQKRGFQQRQDDYSQGENQYYKGKYENPKGYSQNEYSRDSFYANSKYQTDTNRNERNKGYHYQNKQSYETGDQQRLTQGSNQQTTSDVLLEKANQSTYSNSLNSNLNRHKTQNSNTEFEQVINPQVTQTPISSKGSSFITCNTQSCNPVYFTPQSQTSESAGSTCEDIRESLFTTPKPDKSLNHPITLNCMRECAQWSLAIRVGDRKCVKVLQFGVAMRQNGSASSGGLPFSVDIIDNLIQQETSEQCSQIPLHSGYLQQTSSLNLQNFNGFVEQSANCPLEFPVNNQSIEFQKQSLDILRTFTSETMICIEFDLSKLPLSPQTVNQCDVQEINLRQINQAIVESNIHYYINGSCHGQKIFQQDLHFQLQGKKIVKSVQQRIVDYKEHIARQIVSKVQQIQSRKYCACNYQFCPHNPFPHNLYIPQLQPGQAFNLRHYTPLLFTLNQMGQGPYLKRPNTIHAKMLNIPKSIGMEVSFQNLPDVDSFLTNFNQLVLQEGVINKMQFCFDLPLSLLKREQESIQQNSLGIILKDSTNFLGSGSKQKTDVHGLPKVFNLLQEFQKIKEPLNDSSNISSSQQSNIIQRQQSQQQSNLSAYQQTSTFNYRLQQPNFNQGPNIYQHYCQFPFNPQVLLNQIQMLPSVQNFNNQMPVQQFNMKYQQRQNYGHQYQHQDQQRQRYQLQSNLDKLLTAITPRFTTISLTLSDFFEQFREVSTFGLKVLLDFDSQNPSVTNKMVSTFIPTLSSLYLSYFEHEKPLSQINQLDFSEVCDDQTDEEYNDEGDQAVKPKCIDFGEESINSETVESQDRDSTGNNSFIDKINAKETVQTKTQVPNIKHRILEYHEEVPYYLREPLIYKTDQILSSNSNLGKIKVSGQQLDINLDNSWFALTWQQLRNTSLSEDSQFCPSADLCQQFLALYRFTADPLAPSHLELLGFTSLKDDDSLFWVQPHLQAPVTFDISRQLYRERNKQIDRKRVMRERATEFFEVEEFKTYDYQLFCNGQAYFQ